MTEWMDRALDIAHTTGFKLCWGTAGDKRFITIDLPDQPVPLQFEGRTLDEAAWAMCVSEFPDPDDRPEP